MDGPLILGPSREGEEWRENEKVLAAWNYGKVALFIREIETYKVTLFVNIDQTGDSELQSNIVYKF